MEKEIEITKLAYGGEGLGMLDGKVCFVEGALPGEKVLARVFQDKGNFARARILKILRASGERREPECLYVKDCGGCQYQHVSYEEELRWKEIQVREYLERYLKIAPGRVQTIVGMKAPYRYRNTVTLHAQRNKVGFIGRDNRSLVEIQDCLLADERFAGSFSAKGFGKESRKTFRLSASGEVLSGEEDTLFEVAVEEKKLVTGSKSFFQNNLLMTAEIASRITEWTRRAAPQVFMDLFAGVGTFSALASGGAKKIVCVENNPRSMEALEKNLKNLGCEFEILRGKVEKVFPSYLKRQVPMKNLLMLDPPRTGMDAAFSEFIASGEKIDSLIYLSCHLGTLARDLGRILKDGNFEVGEVIPFDMFPRTKHIEIAVFLKRSSAN